VRPLQGNSDPSEQSPLHALLAQLLATGSSLDSVVGGIPSNDQALQARLTQTSLEDAHARVRRLEEENGRLRRESGRAEARATIAESRITQLLEQLHQAFSHSAVGADTLAKAAKRLDGTEQFLKMQNDAVRLQATAEAETLRRQVKQLREQVDHLQLDNDQYRRALVAKGGK
jgi:chromosome segregation ATPase